MRVAALILAFSAVARAAEPTVAVMPFRDLAGGNKNVGEAIRETVTTDLREVPGLKVVERGAIDKVLVEQHLQSSASELDPSSTVRVGKLLGASLIVTGAYQRVASNVRLTARFVRVETGEVVGGAKCDGAARDLLSLQDRITVELLHSAGLQKHVARFAKRERPPLKSLKTVELYGDAVAQPDGEKKIEMLQLALNEDPSFDYAARDLDALEKRLHALDRAQHLAEEQKLQELRQKVAAEPEAGPKRLLEAQLATQLSIARRWVELRKMARATHTGTDGAAFFLVSTDASLRDWDAVLHDGEQFLAHWPTSPYLPAVRGLLESTIARKRKEEEGRAAIAGELTKITGRQRWNLCRFAGTYAQYQQHVEARRFYRACLEVGAETPKDVLVPLVREDLELGDFAQARKDLGELERVDPAAFRNNRQNFEMQIPTDG
jgi:TolB-like protein